MIRVVLDHPQELVNIAHVVRAMKNFSLTDLTLVEPVEYDAYRIEGIAHRSGDILRKVKVEATLDAALKDCVHVVGFSARGRTAKRNAQRPREAAAEILAMTEQGPVGLVFGREDKGLSNADLDRCHRVVTIPTDPDYPSMNLGHAVAVALYEVALARGAGSRPFKAPRREAPPAESELVEALVSEVEKALEAIDFFKGKEKELVMRTVREVVHRAPLDRREAKLIRAMAIEAAKRMRLAALGLLMCGSLFRVATAQVDSTRPLSALTTASLGLEWGSGRIGYTLAVGRLHAFNQHIRLGPELTYNMLGVVGDVYTGPYPPCAFPGCIPGPASYEREFVTAALALELSQRPAAGSMYVRVAAGPAAYLQRPDSSSAFRAAASIALGTLQPVGGAALRLEVRSTGVYGGPHGATAFNDRHAVAVTVGIQF